MMDNPELTALCTELARLLLDLAPDDPVFIERVNAFSKRISAEHSRMLDAQAAQHAIELQDEQDRAFGCGWRHGHAEGMSRGHANGYKAGYTAGQERTDRAWKDAWAAYQKAMATHPIPEIDTEEIDAVAAAMAELDAEIASGKKPIH